MRISDLSSDVCSSDLSGLPFERACALAPGVIAGDTLPGEGFPYRKQEDEDAEEGDVGADRGNPVPARKGLRIVEVAARHAGKTQEVLREEYQVDAAENTRKMTVAKPFGAKLTRHLRGERKG